MDGLIKGLIDVALGHGDDRNEESDRQSRDDRSRSSWAEVSVVGLQEPYFSDLALEVCANW